MANPLRRLVELSAELRRRRVYRVAVAYVIVAAGGLQLIDVLVPATRLPGWSDELLLALAITGLPIVLVLAWMFDMTPTGVERTDDAAPRALTGGDGADVQGRAGEVREVAEARDPAPDRGVEPDPLVVAVLPFEDLSGAEEVSPFAIGLHDDILTELSRISSLTVIARSSVLHYQGGEVPVSEVAHRLGAGTVVEGSVRQAGDRVRLNVQLVDARRHAQIWAERYDRELTTSDIFDIQVQLAQTIAAVLRAELTAGERDRVHRHPTENLDAYRAYARGRAALARRASEALRGAAEHFQAAVRLDPGYAPAWAGLSTARVLLADYGFGDEDAVLPAGEEAARRALELDPELAEAHSALGNYFSASRRCTRALACHTRAAELRPSYAQAHQWICWVSLLTGDAERAVKEGREGLRLNPLESEARANLAVALVGVGRSADAAREARRARTDETDFDYARWAEGLALHHRGDHAEATRRMAGLTESWSRHWPEAARGISRARAGDEEGARRLEEALVEDDAFVHAARVAAALGEVDRAFEHLGRSSPTSWSACLYLRFPPDDLLGRLRSDPRWTGVDRMLDQVWGVEREG